MSASPSPVHPGARLTVIIDPEDGSGVTGWKARGADLRDYLEGREGHS